jgi:hypothetical protein
MALDPVKHRIFLVTAEFGPPPAQPPLSPAPGPPFCLTVLWCGLWANKRSGSYMTAGTLIPMTANTRVNSRRTTATVASRNFLRPSSASLRMGWRW